MDTQSEPPTPARMIKRDIVRTHPWWSLLVFVLLLIASNAVDMILDADRVYWGNLYADSHEALSIEIDTSGLPININPLPYRVIQKGNPESTLPPVVLIHGSPGAAIGFDKLAPMLAEEGRRVLYFDLPGFASQAEPITRGSVYEDYSSATYADVIWRMLDELEINGRIHIVGWSNGGAVGLRMVEDRHDQVATLTLLAAVGAQETEGTGSYAFEHFKYKAGRVLLDYGSHFYPHFGILGPASERNAFLRFFDDTDQRDLGAFMEQMDTPTMIMHGRDDFLIAARSAERHHELIPSSQLVMLDAMHFIPFLEAEEASEYLLPFFTRHDAPGVEPITTTTDLAPIPARHGFDRMLHLLGEGLMQLPILLQILIVILIVRYSPILGALLCMVFVATMHLDFAIAAIGLLVGRTWWIVRGAMELNRPWTILRWIRSFLFVIPLFFIGAILGWQIKNLSEHFGIVGFALGLTLGWCVLIAMRLVITWEGRQRIQGWFRRATNHEYWPRVLIYAPVLTWGFKRMIRKGLQPLTAVNPGYAHDGGVQDESKMDLNHKLGDGDAPIDAVLHCVLIDEVSAEQRTESAMRAIEHDPQLNGFPIIAKPDKGERGRAVKLLKDADGLCEYCQNCSEPFVLQRFHPGPHEIGVLWMRRAESISDPKDDGPIGFIYAITIKHFPTLRGDGKRTLRRLILSHKRHRAQPGVFFEYNKSRLDWVPQDSEKVILGIAGNHAQGAKFTDGSHLITQKLTDRMNEIIQGFDQRAGRGFDIGRFDLRCESLEELKEGRGFGIVELNGLTSEPTNLYDPKRSLFWAWGMLLGYWKHLERLAEARIATKTGEPVDDRTWDKIRNALIRSMI